MDPQHIPSTYTQTIAIPSYDGGPNQCLRLSNMLRYQQEAGEKQFAPYGLGFQGLREEGMAFVITRLNLLVHRAPLATETIQLTTWHRAAKGAQFYRCYVWRDEQGQPLVEGVSAFALVDPDSHRVLRPSAFARFGIAEQPHRSNNCPDPVRLTLPDSMMAAGEREVRWSDIDYNGHLNNAVYADIVWDTLPRDWQDRHVTFASLSFLNEALQGESIRLRADCRETAEGGVAFVAGSHDRGTCFEACLRMAPSVKAADFAAGDGQ